MDVECSLCHALHWIDEKVADSPVRNPTFSKCCHGGKVALPPLQPPLAPLNGLFNGSHPRARVFLSSIRRYNCNFQLASQGIKFSTSAQPGSGPRTMRMQGRAYHLLGPMRPVPGQPARFAQLYINDTDQVGPWALRLHILFSHPMPLPILSYPWYSPQARQQAAATAGAPLDAALMQDLRGMLHDCNPFVATLKAVASSSSPNLVMTIDQRGGPCLQCEPPLPLLCFA